VELGFRIWDLGGQIEKKKFRGSKQKKKKKKKFRSKILIFFLFFFFFIFWGETLGLGGARLPQGQG
jgi:hypothetical protein